MELKIFTKNKLMNELKAWGLNPQEWFFDRGLWGHQQPQVLRNKFDKEFCLIGTTEKKDGFLSWSSLQILSL